MAWQSGPAALGQDVPGQHSPGRGVTGHEVLPGSLSSDETIAVVAAPRTYVGTAVATLALDNGEEFPLDRPIVLGRAPQEPVGAEGARLVPVADARRSVSSSHVMIGPAGPGVWVQDLDSTNGVRLTVAGAVRELAAGERVEAPVGCTVEYGLRTIEVNAS